MSTITQAQYDKVCEAIDRAKNDDRSLDTGEYADIVLDALGVTVDSGRNPVTLRVPTSRPIGDDEIASLIYGTGALTYEWWGGALEEERDGVDGYLFYHATEDSPDDGSTPGRTWVSEQQIADAAGRFLGEGRGGSEARDMLTEDIGFADAEAADIILQYAVLGRAIFG
ncbi:hypothetical protein PBI_HYPERION_82 [Microbacterium phage Hyperion]|uniref:Uncharacterized protein n=1 Tax=Microbacterium phage Hyperion TaxID=2182354 RepID=A0A2U8UIW8_9CAUD|nr:hypothetical protein HOT27_gp082 [Microbacterium phage Hyperion]AWN03597.1 hypothetical protein PBI_HYPERION_82 [Microbacterium phage Hyperion]